jgi:quercetin dioxygenase-like cupin family protein
MNDGDQGAIKPWHEPGEGQQSGWGSWKRGLTVYDQFMEAEGIPVYRGIGVEQVQDLPLRYWDRVGGNATFIQLHGTEGMWGMYVVEIPPRAALKVEQHLYEEIVYVVEGRGSAEVWQVNARNKKMFEWAAGTLFAIPLNARHRLVNATNDRVLLLVGTTAPNIMNLLQDIDGVFNCDHAFTGQFNEEDDYYRPQDLLEADPVRGLAMVRSNIVPDLAHSVLPVDNRRSPGFRRIEPHMASENFYMWCGEHETGRYSKAHKHASGAVLVCIGGEGYTYTWPESLGTTPWQDGLGDKVMKQDYRPVGMVSAAPMSGKWYHQHFGVGKTPLRLLAMFGPNDTHRRGGIPGDEGRDLGAIDVKQGGSAIQYRDEDPHVWQEFDQRLRRSGVENRMTAEVLDMTYEFTPREVYRQP